MPSIMKRGREGEKESVRNKACEKTNEKQIEIERIQHACIIIIICDQTSPTQFITSIFDYINIHFLSIAHCLQTTEWKQFKVGNLDTI